MRAARASRSIGNFPTREAAIARAKQALKALGGGELVVYAADGSEPERHYVRFLVDAFPPRLEQQPPVPA